MMCNAANNRVLIGIELSGDQSSGMEREKENI